MLLNKLIIHNIASIEDATIDFRDDILRDTPIFLICGKTGAGKSTILDAISLALYANTPRMASSAKEELNAYGDDTREKRYANDNSQLLRRGSGEGFVKLYFTGNDGKEWLATWEIHRKYSKPGNDLMRPTRALECLDGSHDSSKITEVNEKIVEITGLDYGQFCRTVMLAQGEFTKFLKSDRKDKSEILEKLTGTEIYSEISKRINRKYLEFKHAYEDVNRQVEGVTLLSEEEKLQIASQMDELRVKGDALRIESQVVGSKMEWLKAQEKLAKDVEKAAKELSEVTAKTDTMEFQDNCRLVEEYDLTAVARQTLLDMRKADVAHRKDVGALPDVISRYESADKDEKKAADELQGKKAVEEAKQKEYDACNREETDRLYQENSQLDKSLADMAAQGNKLAGELTLLQTHKDSYDAKVKELAMLQKSLTDLTEPLKQAKLQKEEATKNLDNASISMNDLVKDIRADLKVGDICPVCGQKVLKKLGDSYFESILSPLREAKRKAEDEFTKLETERVSHEKLIKIRSHEAKDSQQQAAEQQKKVDREQKKFDKLRNALGIDTALTVEESLALGKKQREELKGLIEELKERQSAANALQIALRECTKEKEKAATRHQTAKERTAERKLEMSKLQERINNGREQINGYKDAIDDFLGQHPEITSEFLSELATRDPREMRKMKEEVEKLAKEAETLKVRHTTLSEQLKEHEDSRPEFADEETLESLTARREEINRDLTANGEEYGRLREITDNDKRRHDELQEKIEERDKARDVMERWEGLNSRIGSADGSKFRAVAQGFILESLLQNANVYMQSFTDRYTLTSNPGSLAILVKDSYKPSEAQPASILSGGESFMASLALALGLSNLRGGSIGTDIIFIDEGFGTLSPEYLGNVMSTLEKLHNIAGRKVGLISHVPEMRERIPVHISVERQNESLSTVSIVG